MTTAMIPVTITHPRMTAKERKMRAQAQRRRKLARLLSIVLLHVERAVRYIQVASVDAPARIKSKMVDWFIAIICLMLMAAVFFAVSGLMALALDFWLSTYPYW